MLCHDIGPLDALIMIIGEAPGREEDLKGEPFVGSAGKLLKSMCKAIGLDFHQAYVTNVSPERPPSNNFGYFYEDSKRSIPKKSLSKCWFDLKDKIQRIKPKVVICLGEEPLRAVTNKRGIGAWRGSRIDAHGTVVIGTYHPSAVLRQASMKLDDRGKGRAPVYRVVVEMDLHKAKKIAEGAKVPEHEIITSPGIDEALSWLQSAKMGAKVVSFDIETIGMAVRSISFAYRRSLPIEAGEWTGITSISIPFIRMVSSTSPASFKIGNGTIIKPSGGGDPNYWSAEDEEHILNAIVAILEDKNIEKLGQNSIKFDAPLIKKSFEVEIINHRFDLMHAWHVLYPSLPKSLNFICSAICDYPNYWTEHDVEVDESEWYYNAMDSVATLDAAEKVKVAMKDEGYTEFYYDFIYPLVEALKRAEEKGVLWDKEEAEKMKKELSENLIEVKKKLSEFAGEDFNPLSPKQVKELLYVKLGFPTIRHHKTKTVTTNEDALRRLQMKYPDEPVLRLIIKHRKISKLISTYIDVKVDEDGRIRCSYDASGTKTGRISSSKNLFGTGMDLHNIPKGYTRGVSSTRHLYRADDGFIFVAGDLKQAEAMVVAWILAGLGDRMLYDFYHDPSFDIHKWCAANFVYLIDEKDVTKHQRNQGGKLANHSGNYKAGPKVMQRRATQEGYEGFTYRWCKEILERRINGIPGLRIWWQKVEETIKATREMRTCFGRRLHFFGRLDDDEVRSAVAFEPQSTVGDVTNKMFIELSKSDLWTPVLTTHDEVVLLGEERYRDDMAQALIDASKIPLMIRKNIEPLIIPIELEFGKNWRDLNEWKKE